jgi:hypothetical protein
VRATARDGYTPCYCSAYPFPHRPGGGRCEATGEVVCPNCDVVLDDDQVVWVLWAMATRYLPAEYAPALRWPCGKCGVVGVVV